MFVVLTKSMFVVSKHALNAGIVIILIFVFLIFNSVFVVTKHPIYFFMHYNKILF